jgi:hypothetical protein
LKSSQLRLFAEGLWESPRIPCCCRKMGKWLADGFPSSQMHSPYNNKQEKSCKT